MFCIVSVTGMIWSMQGESGCGNFSRKGNNNKYDTRTRLVERRKEAYQHVSDYLELLKKSRKLTKAKLEELIAREEQNPHEFSGVILFVYQTALKKCMQQASETN